MARLTKKRKIAILRRAREILTPRGRWIKGWYRERGKDGEFRYCLVGAVNAATRELYPDLYPGYPSERLVDEISLRSFVEEKTGKHSIPVFNDLSKTRKKDVLGILDEYVAVLESA